MSVEIVKEIHNAFDTASERLLKEAQTIANGKIDDSKAERIKKLGFGSAKPIGEIKAKQEAKSKAPKLIETILYFQQHYPNYKFITEDEVKSICAKYGLLLGDASDYIGDIPDKNLSEIEAFELRKEDWLEKANSWWSDMGSLANIQQMYYARMLDAMSTPQSELLGAVSYGSRRSGRTDAYSRAIEQLSRPIYNSGIDPYKSETKKEEKKEYEKPAFKIVAPKDDFKTQDMIVVDGYKIQDPIVLQPVKDGYLVISKWGLGSDDETLINEKLN